MSKKLKNRQKQSAKKLQKQKARQLANNKKHNISKQILPAINMVDRVDDALELVQQGDLAQGKKSILKLSKKHPNNSNINFGLGVIAIQEESHLQAIEFFKKAIEKSPNFTEAYFNLGACYKHELKFVAMVHAFKMVLKTGDADDIITQQAQEVLDTLAESVHENNGLNLEAYISCNEMFDQGVEEMAQQSWLSASICFKKVLELDVDHIQSYGNLGICYAHMGEKTSAIESLEKALKLDPCYGVALVNLECIKRLEEGESLKGPMKVVEYYKDYGADTASYIEDVTA
jgi:tetratricopeptide (TPR) repeat protein